MKNIKLLSNLAKSILRNRSLSPAAILTFRADSISYTTFWIIVFTIRPFELTSCKASWMILYFQYAPFVSTTSNYQQFPVFSSLSHFLFIPFLLLSRIKLHFDSSSYLVLNWSNSSITFMMLFDICHINFDWLKQSNCLSASVDLRPFHFFFAHISSFHVFHIHFLAEFSL